MKLFGYIAIGAALTGLAFVAAPKFNGNTDTENSSKSCELCEVDKTQNVASVKEGNGIDFQNITFDEALKQAKKEKKYIFMNVYAVWCGPCKLLKQTTFQSEEVAKVINENFINIDIDAEKGEGIELAQKYNVRAHPLMLIIDENGKAVKSILGYRKDAQLLKDIKDYLK